MACNPRYKGGAAFLRSIKEQMRDPEFDLEKAELIADGADPWNVIEEMSKNPKWQAPVDMEEEDAIVELDRLVKSGKTCPEAIIVRWVASNATNKRAIFDDAPDPVAWNLLMHIRTHAAAAGEFWKQTWPKLMPTNKELENQARYADDGSTEIELANRIKARMLENASQD